MDRLNVEEVAFLDYKKDGYPFLSQGRVLGNPSLNTLDSPKCRNGKTRHIRNERTNTLRKIIKTY